MSNAKERIRQEYTGNFGKNYHASVHSFELQTLEVLAKQRANKLQKFVSSDDKVLEFGVGLGVNLLNLKCKERVGYDASDAGNEICTNMGIKFTNDIASIQKDSFSAVICHHVLEHVPDPVDVLDQIKSFLIPNGKLILCVPFETSNRFRRYYPGDKNRHIYAWNVLTLGNLVSAVGFNIQYVKPHPFGYEQRLSFLAKYGFNAYRFGLWTIRKLMPLEEIILVATKE